MPNSSRLQLFTPLYPPLLLLPSFSRSLLFNQQMNCLGGGLDSVGEVRGLRQGQVCLQLQGAEHQSRLFCFQPRHFKNLKGGRDSWQAEKLCFPSHFKIALNLWSGLNPSSSGNYRDDFVRTSCSGLSVQPNTASLKKKAQSRSWNGADLGSGCRDTPAGGLGVSVLPCASLWVSCPAFCNKFTLTHAAQRLEHSVRKATDFVVSVSVKRVWAIINNRERNAPNVLYLGFSRR